MNKIGIYICNYNGKDFTVNCIHSLKKQNYKDFDVHVVDNASTDGTVECIHELFPEVIVYENEENIGGAGGFDRGLQEGIRKGYEYIVLLDNDVVLEEKLVSTMYQFLCEHRDVGIVGSKVMIMDLPDTIQDYGDYLNFQKFKEINAFSFEKDNKNIPEINECDYVPTCAVMIRTEAVRQSGTMPIDNFIYYDDIELSHKMVLNGWKVYALGNAKVWHKGGFRKAAVNTFSRYYFLRNRLNFFAKYIDEEEIDHFIDVMLAEVFSRLYGFHIKEMKEVLETTQYAFDDFLHGVRGKAADYKILKLSNNATPFEKLVIGKKRIRINLIDNFVKENSTEIFGILVYILTNIQKVSPQEKIYISLANCSFTVEAFWKSMNKEIALAERHESLPEICLADDSGDYDLVLQMCEHVSKVNANILPVAYVDRYCNCISTESEYRYFTNSEEAEKFFKSIYRPLMLQAVMRVREEKI